MATLQESAQSILNEKNLKVLPENIVKGITMFGVEGTAEISVSADTLLWNIIPQGYGTTSRTEPTVGDVVTYYDYTGSYAENNHTTMERYNYNTEIEAEKPRVNDLVIGRSPMNYDQPGRDNAYLPYYILGQVTSIAPQSWEPEIIEYNVKILGYYQGYISIEELAANSTAEASDIVMDKIAYTKNGQISGTLSPQEYVGLMDNTEGYWSYAFEGEHFKPSARMNGRTLIANGAQVEFYLPQNEVAAAAGITGDKVVSGYSILGVEGTAEMGGTSGLTVITSLEELATLTDTSKKVALISPEKLEKIIDKMGPSIFIRKEFTMEEALPNGYKFAYFYTASGEWNMSSWGSYIDFELRDNNTGDTLKSYHWERQSDGLTYVRNGSDEIVFLGGSYNAGSSSYPEILRITSTAFANYSAADNKIYEHNGTEWVLADGQIDTTDATAQARDIAKGKTAYINGEKVTGSVTVGDDYLRLDVREIWQNGDLTHIFFDQDRFESDVLYRNGTHIESNLSTSQVASDLGITADKIATGCTILDIEGTGGSGIDTSDATATCADILAGKTAYVNGQLIEGEIMDIGVAHGLTSNFNNDDDILLVIEGTAFDSGYITSGQTTLSLDTNKLDLAEAVGLTADKIVEGNTILGIEGTAVVGAALAEGAPIVSSYAELANITDTSKPAIVLQEAGEITRTDGKIGPKFYIPQTVILDTAITEDISEYGSAALDNCQELSGFYFSINISKDYISIDFSNNESGGQSYNFYFDNSETGDGLTYTCYEAGTVLNLYDTLTLANIGSEYIESIISKFLLTYQSEDAKVYEYNGTQWVMAPGQVDTSIGNVKANEMLVGKIAFVDGKKVIGTVSQAYSLDTTELNYSYEYDNKLYFYNNNPITEGPKLINENTSFEVYIDQTSLAESLGITADKIKKGETILGITGTYEGDFSETITPEEYNEAQDQINDLLGEEEA